MRRYLLVLALGVAGLALLWGLATSRPVAGAYPATMAAPVVDCSIQTVTMNLTADMGVPALRPFANTVGDAFVQFPATTITTTAASTTSLSLNGTFNGTLSGTFSGTTQADGVNGVLVTAPEGLITTPRGFTLGRVVLVTAQGTITAVLVLNDAATTNTPPYYP